MKKSLIPMIVVVAVSLFAVRPADAKPEIKFALAILHYNLQYVAGDTEIENRIIEQSLDPMMDFYLAHPNWSADVEMQGYMLEETAKRYPKIFEKLKKLVNEGRIDLVSFHYADQLFLAYPRLDMDWSDRINRRIFESLGVTKHSGSVFAQEGQFGEGMAAFMADHGYTTLVLPKNLYRYAHGEKDAAPYYGLNGVNVVIGGRGVDYDGPEASVKTQWTYMDDAELLPTARCTPYSQYFKYIPKTLEDYADRLAGLEKQGYRIGSISQYVEALKAAGVKPAKLEPMFDGVWQPKDTDNVFRWMGDYRAQFERDNEVLTGNVSSRHKLAAAAVLIDKLREKGTDTAQLEKDLDTAWVNQSHAEVSDSTGWTPMPIEIEFSMNNSKHATEIAQDIARRAAAALGMDRITVNVATREVSAKPADIPKATEAPCPVEPTLTGDITKRQITCFKISDSVTRLDLKFKTTNWSKNNVRLSFPRSADYMLFSPAMLENTFVKYPISAFKPELDSFYIPAPNGLIALSDNLFLIKKTDSVHLAYRISMKEPYIAIDMNKPPNKTHNWTLYFFTGTPQEALDFANGMNVFPVVSFDGLK